MLGLPSSTVVNSRVTKEKLYSNVTLTTPVRDMIKNQIESVIWRNKLADSTFAVAAGETVKEIQVFEVAIRQRGLDKRVLSAIVKAIPYKILFILTFADEVQAWMEVSGTFYNTDWLSIEGFMFKFEGLNLDTVYENLARQIAGGRLGTEGDIAEAANLDKQRRQIEREITSLEKKVLREKQFNRQVELNSKLKRLKDKLGELNL